jgi:hypothetical protein
MYVFCVIWVWLVAWFLCIAQAIRVFVESVLRYGLPVNFVAALIKPGRGADKKLHELLHVSSLYVPQPTPFVSVMAFTFLEGCCAGSDSGRSPLSAFLALPFVYAGLIRPPSW